MDYTYEIWINRAPYGDADLIIEDGDLGSLSDSQLFRNQIKNIIYNHGVEVKIYLRTNWNNTISLINNNYIRRNSYIRP
jgi:hypothetical protein